MRGTLSRRTRCIALLLIVLVGLGLRTYNIDSQSLWNDEGTSVALAQRDLPTIARNAAQDIHPPLYYYLLHYWARLWGTSEMAVRSLSAIASAFAVLAVYALGRGLRGDGLGLLAACFAAVSPLQVYYAQETRMYALAALLGVLVTLALERCLRELRENGRCSRMAAALYALSSIAAVYTHYLCFALVLAHNLYAMIWLFSTRRRAGIGDAIRACLRWAPIPIAIALAYVPWLLTSWRSLTSWPAVGLDLSLAGTAYSFSRVLALGVTHPQTPSTLYIVTALSLIPLIGVMADLVRRPEPDEDATLGWPGLVAGYLLIPLAVIVVMSLQRAMYKPKFLLLVAPAYALAMAQGILVIAGLVRRWLAGRLPAAVAALLALACAAPMAVSLGHLYWDADYARDDYRGIAAYIVATSGQNDAILINAPSQIETFDYYYHGPLPEYPLPRSRPLDEAKTISALEDMAADHARIYAILWATDESDPDGIIESWLDGHTFKAMDSWFGNLRLASYSTPIDALDAAQRVTDYALGDHIRLVGYSLLTPEPASGGVIQLTLYWQTEQALDARYKVFTHLLDPRGNIIGQRDSEPSGGSRPTTSWAPGETIADNYGLLVPPGSPSGDYVLRVGMYALEGFERLPISERGQAMGDALDLLTIRVQAPTTAPPKEAMDIEVDRSDRMGGLELIGHSLRRVGHEHEDLLLMPGDAAKLTLFWERAGDGSVGDAYTVALEKRGDRVFAQKLRILGGSMPPGEWRSGERIRDVQQVQLPTDLPTGAYRLVLEPLWTDADAVRLQRVTIGQ